MLWLPAVDRLGFIYIYIYVHKHIYIYIYIHTHTHTYIYTYIIRLPSGVRASFWSGVFVPAGPQSPTALELKRGIVGHILG